MILSDICPQNAILLSHRLLEHLLETRQIRHPRCDAAGVWGWCYPKTFVVLLTDAEPYVITRNRFRTWCPETLWDGSAANKGIDGIWEWRGTAAPALSRPFYMAATERGPPNSAPSLPDAVNTFICRINSFVAASHICVRFGAYRSFEGRKSALNSRGRRSMG